MHMYLPAFQRLARGARRSPVHGRRSTRSTLLSRFEKDGCVPPVDGRFTPGQLIIANDDHILFERMES